MNRRETSRLYKLYVELGDLARKEQFAKEAAAREGRSIDVIFHAGTSYAHKEDAQRIYEIFLGKEEECQTGS